MSFARYFILLIITGIPVFGNTDLIVVTGNASHSPELGVPPPLLSELIERAHQNAIDKLGTTEAFHQVIAWKDRIECEEVYRGSPNCYIGSVTSTASFIPQSSINDGWQVTTSSYVFLWERDDNERAIERTRQETLRDAQFFCGSDVATPFDVEEKKVRYQNDETGYWKIHYSYKATYPCLKTPKSRL